MKRSVFPQRKITPQQVTSTGQDESFRRSWKIVKISQNSNGSSMATAFGIHCPTWKSSMMWSLCWPSWNRAMTFQLRSFTQCITEAWAKSRIRPGQFIWCWWKLPQTEFPTVSFREGHIRYRRWAWTHWMAVEAGINYKVSPGRKLMTTSCPFALRQHDTNLVSGWLGKFNEMGFDAGIVFTQIPVQQKRSCTIDELSTILRMASASMMEFVLPTGILFSSNNITNRVKSLPTHHLKREEI